MLSGTTSLKIDSPILACRIYFKFNDCQSFPVSFIKFKIFSSKVCHVVNVTSLSAGQKSQSQSFKVKVL